MLRDLPVNVVQPVAMVWNQHFLHDGQLCQSVAAHFDKLHEGAAGHFTLSQADGRQLCAPLGDADQLFVQGPQPVGADHQFDQAGAGEADTTQNVFADGSAEVQVSNRDLVAEERPKFILVKEEVHDQVELGRVVHHGVPAALLNGVELLARILTNHVDAEVFQVDVLL